MKKIICLAALASAMYLLAQKNETIAANSGFDDLSRSIEVSISHNPVASMVFGMDDSEAVEVFGYNGERA